MPTLLKRLKDLRYQMFYGLVLNRRFERTVMGAEGSICHWTICPTGLSQRSIVYSAGVGSDISFEHALVAKFNCQVVLIDPSPTGVKTMELTENKIPQFHFFPFALAGRNGKISLSPPLDVNGDSWFVRADVPGTVEVPCTDVSSLMKQNRHDHIDLLKLDIEGCEYEVIEDILKRRLPVSQIAVEFHHGILPGIRRSQTIRTMLKMIRHGYALIDQTGANHTFIRK